MFEDLKEYERTRTVVYVVLYGWVVQMELNRISCISVWGTERTTMDTSPKVHNNTQLMNNSSTESKTICMYMLRKRGTEWKSDFYSLSHSHLNQFNGTHSAWVRMSMFSFREFRSSAFICVRFSVDFSYIVSGISIPRIHRQASLHFYATVRCGSANGWFDGMYYDYSVCVCMCVRAHCCRREFYSFIRCYIYCKTAVLVWMCSSFLIVFVFFSVLYA